MSKTQKVQSIERALSILECFSINETALSILEISEKIDLPRPTIARLVYTLESRGYLMRKGSSKKYSLGMSLFRLGTIVQNSIQLSTVARPILKKLQAISNETVYLDVIDGNYRLCVLSFESNHTIRSVVPVGQRSPLHAGSDGKVLLAYQPEKYINDFIQNSYLKSFTANTITDPERLKKELSIIREKGYSLSYAEYSPDSAGISSPVWDGTGNVVAAISLSLPQYRATEDTVKIYIRELQKASQALSRQLGADMD
ncbi:IclR family transcriptional regulator [Desulfocucumis palustris]|nr:IclR family transcriptional regulator [Desulfocucumis palustris]